MRRIVDFHCAGETLVGTLDAAEGTTGILIVSGGNEIRCGAHRGMAMLAADLAERGVPVFRFDRRGVGDSTGVNGGYDTSTPDIVAAARAFRELAPHMTRIVGLGNCDAATALALFHREARIDRLVLTNPWVGNEADGLPPAAAIRAHYAGRASDAGQWGRLLTGKVNIGNLFSGLLKSSRKSREDNEVADHMAVALVDTPCTILLAEGDNTAIRFAGAWGHDVPIERRASDSHSFARPGDHDWLIERVLAALA
jgi:exosortase A-associated hydrolase 1